MMMMTWIIYIYIFVKEKNKSRHVLYDARCALTR